MKFTNCDMFLLGWLAIRASLDIVLIVWKILESR